MGGRVDSEIYNGTGVKKLNDLDHFLRVGKLYFIWESAETWDATIESTGHGLSRVA